MKNQFFNIQAAEITKIADSASANITKLQTMKTTKDILDKWYFKNLLTRGALAKVWQVENLITYITDRINKETAKKVSEIKNRIAAVTDAEKQIVSMSISVEWSKSRTWGNCPKAEVRVCFSDNTCDNYESSRITGCGYDKESTAIANAINQCNEFLNLLYCKKDTDIKKENRELFGYGSGYGVRPYLEGGVGVSCYPAIFESLGYKWQGVSHGKAFDVYSVELNKK